MPEEEPVTHETTDNYDLRFPTDTAPIDTAGDIQRLAEDTDAALDDKQPAGSYAATNHGYHVPTNNTAPLGTWYLSPTSPNTTAWAEAKNYLVEQRSNLIQVNLGGVGYGGSAFYYHNSATPWSNQFLLSVMTAIQQFAPASSESVKDDIKPLATPDSDTLRADANGTYVTDAFANINPIHFTYKDDGRIAERERGRERFGFIAEEVHAAGVATDEWVFDLDTGEKDDDGLPVMEKAEPIRLLKEIDLTAILWAKVKELEQRIADMEAGDA